LVQPVEALTELPERFPGQLGRHVRVDLGFSSDIQVATGRWKWVRLDPASLSGVELSQIILREPAVLRTLVENHSQYDAPLTLAAVGEDI